MPVFGLPAGPRRLKIKNDTVDKTIEEVKVRTAPRGGPEAQHTQPVLIPPGAEMIFEDPTSEEAEYYCVRLGWTGPTSGWGANECCSDNPLLGGDVEEIVVTLVEAAPSILMSIKPEGGESVPCACLGGTP